MNKLPVIVPQLGEGVRQARIVGTLKKAGDRVEKDEPLVEVETDKAVHVIESPATGIVGEWHASTGSVPVGTVLTWIMAEGVIRNAVISPRVLAWCKQNDVSDEMLLEIDAAGGGRTLRIEDIVAWVSAAKDAPKPLGPDRATSAQEAFGARIERAWRVGAPGWVEVDADWGGIDAARARLRRTSSRATTISVLAWCVLRAARSHPVLLSSPKSEWFSLGIAVAQPADAGVATVVVTDDGGVDFRSFEQVSGENGDAAKVNLHLSFVAPFGIDAGVPVVVPPSIGTLLVGAAREVPVRGEGAEVRWERRARVVLGFDHRLMNGAGAGAFLRSLRAEMRRPAI